VALVLLESLRLHQWAKNVLIFIPLILGGSIHSAEAWTATLIGFVALGTLTSSMYLINDLCDLPFDRQHWSKRKRPLARGDLPLNVVLPIVPLGVLLSLGIAASIGRVAVLMLLVYGATSLTYSLYLKRLPILDVFMLALLMTFRLCLGIELADVTPSPWLLVFSMFIFTSLSLAKRHVEVARNGAFGRKSVEGRGYVDKDGPVLIGLGLATAVGAVLIMILYLINEAFGATFYRSPALLWALPAILFLWLGRVWLLVGRDELDDDPLWFAVRDNISLILGAAMVVVFVSAWQL
jgi:4-hydroxybenzoate polyprenyltransferase